MSGGDLSEAENTNGVYCFRIDKEIEGYSVYGGGDPIVVQTVKINGSYIGISDAVEIECRDYELEDDTLNLIMQEGGDSSSGSAERDPEKRELADAEEGKASSGEPLKPSDQLLNDFGELVKEYIQTYLDYIYDQDVSLDYRDGWQDALDAVATDMLGRKNEDTVEKLREDL